MENMEKLGVSVLASLCLNIECAHFPPTLLRPMHCSAQPDRPQRLHAFLFSPVDIVWLVIFRIAFGAIMLWEVWRYFAMDRIEPSSFSWTAKVG